MRQTMKTQVLSVSHSNKGLKAVHWSGMLDERVKLLSGGAIPSFTCDFNPLFWREQADVRLNDNVKVDKLLKTLDDEIDWSSINCHLHPKDTKD